MFLISVRSCCGMLLDLRLCAFRSGACSSCWLIVRLGDNSLHACRCVLINQTVFFNVSLGLHSVKLNPTCPLLVETEMLDVEARN